MPGNDCHILTLPTEILQHVASFTTNEGLLVLRSTCKEFSAAIADSLAERFFKEIYCFVADPLRLQRLGDIVSRPHLTRKTEKIVLTANAFEAHDYYQRGIDTVQGPEDQHLPVELVQISVRRKYIEERFRLHHVEKPDISALSTMLPNLNPAKCHLHLRLTHEGSPPYDTRLPNLIRDVLRITAQAGYPVSSLYLDIHGAKDLDRLLKSSEEVFNAMKRLRDVTLSMNDGPSFDEEEEEFSYQSMTKVVSSATAVESLDVMLKSAKWALPKQAQFGSDLLSVNNFSCLRTLDVGYFTLTSFQSLLDALSHCKATLERLRLIAVYITSQQNQWKEIMRHLCDLPKLQDLEWHALGIEVQRTWFALYYADENGSDKSYAGLPEDDIADWMVRLHEESKEDIDTAIRRALEREMIFRLHDYEAV